MYFKQLMHFYLKHLNKIDFNYESAYTFNVCFYCRQQMPILSYEPFNM